MPAEREYQFILLLQRGGWKYRVSEFKMTNDQARRYRKICQKQVNTVDKRVKVRMFREVA